MSTKTYLIGQVALTLALFGIFSGCQKKSTTGSSTTEELSGTISVTYEGDALVTGDTFSFGVVKENVNAGSLSFDVTNTAEDTLTISSLTLGGTNSDQFSITTSPSTSLEEGETTTFAIAFLPTTSGAKTATLTAETSSGTYSLTLTGNTTWGSNIVDGNAVDGLNYDSDDAFMPEGIICNDRFYATWYEDNGITNQIRVAVYNGDDDAPAWTKVDGGGINGINADPALSALQPSGVCFESKVYLTWYEASPTGQQIRVYVYNGNDSAPTWTAVDANGTDGLNKVSTRSATTPHLFIFSDKLYATWNERNPSNIQQIRVALYNGNDSSPAWSFVDGNGTNGLNRDVTRAGFEPVLVELSSKLYLFWYELNSSNIRQIRGRVYNGNDSSPSWTFIDGGGTNGLNKSTTRNAYSPRPIAFNDKLYLTWDEDNSSSVSQIRVSVYGGNDLAPIWTFVDGNGTNGVNFATTFSAIYSSPTVFLNRLYLGWEEDSSVAYQTRIKLYNANDASPSWASVDLASSGGINVNTSFDGFHPRFVTFNSKLYALWSELHVDGFFKVRSSVANQ